MTKDVDVDPSGKSSNKNKRHAIQKVGEKAGLQFDKYVVEQFSKLKHVRRPVLTWLLLIFVLIVAVFLQTRQLRGYYIDEVPISGGVLKEGMVGKITNINPLYNANSADRSLSKLIFASLLSYNENGEIIGDLARKWKANSSGSVYTMTLRDTAYWHDGQPVTADDVVFTFDTLQHPDANSPLAAVWRGVKVTKESKNIVNFALPNPFAPFLHSLVNLGILPKHILEDVGPDQLRGHRFNLAEPIGAGPFQLIESLVINDSDNIGSGIIRFRLIAHDEYHFGRPRLDSLMLFTYDDREVMISDFNGGELTIIGGLVASDIPSRDSMELIENDVLDILPNNIDSVTLETKSTDTKSVPRTSQVMLFLNNSSTNLKNIDIRKGIALAIDREAIVDLADSFYINSRSPLLKFHLGYDNKVLLPSRNLKKAADHLKKAGWQLAGDGYRYKNDQRLTLTIVSQADDILPEALNTIQKNLKEVGIFVHATIVGSETIQQDFLAEHEYESVLFGINVGRDPDQFAFWHSSQRSLNGRNLSLYNSSVADTALEAGRTRIDEELRIAKYKAFQKQWVNDVPAIALYQPTYIYTFKKQVNGLHLETLANEEDRYHNVHKWTVNIGQSEMLY